MSDHYSDSDFLRANQTTDIERAVIATCLEYPEALADLDGRIRAEHFRQDGHRATWSAMLAVRDSGLAVDVLAVDNRMRAEGTAEAVGSASGLSAWVSQYADRDKVDGYARILEQTHQRKQVARELTRLVDSVPTDPGMVGGFVEDAIASLSGLADVGCSGDEWGDPSAALRVIFDNIQRRLRGEPEIGVKSGIKALDDVVRAWKPGAHVVVAARPSIGKSMFSGCVALNHVQAGGACLLFSAEMSEVELRERLLARQTRLGMSRISGHDLAHGDGPRIMSAAEDQMRLALRIVDQPKTAEQIRAIVRRWLRADCGPRDGVGLVIVDYLQILPSGRRYGNRQEEVSAASVSLKRLARECGVVVLTLSQLNRESERRSNPRPILSDLRESGAIEQDADQVIALHRERDDKGNLTDRGLLCVLKNRNGTTGPIDVRFDGAMQEVTDWS